jgi:hypothetical protein
VTIPTATIQDVLKGLRSADADDRSNSAEVTTDFPESLTPDQARELTAALVRAAIGEVDVDAREAELHAVYILQAWNQLDPNLVRPVLALESAPDLGPSERTYLQSLREFVDRS